MKDINELRDKIDKIDVQLIKLFEERMNISQEIAEYKEKNGLAIYDENRELNVIKKNIQHANENYKDYVVEFIKCIMQISKDVQSRR